MRNKVTKLLYNWPSTTLPSARQHPMFMDGLQNKLIASKSTRFHHYSRVKRTPASASFLKDTISSTKAILSTTPQKLSVDNHFQEKLRFLSTEKPTSKSATEAKAPSENKID